MDRWANKRKGDRILFLYTRTWEEKNCNSGSHEAHIEAKSMMMQDRGRGDDNSEATTNSEAGRSRCRSKTNPSPKVLQQI